MSKNDWVELNLPFYVSVCDVDLKIKHPKMPSLKRREKKELGMTCEENEKTLLTGDEDFYLTGVIYREFVKHNDKIIASLEKKKLSDDEIKLVKRKKLQSLAKKNKAIELVLAFYDHKKKYDDWLEKQPEWIKYCEESDKCILQEQEMLKNMSFEKMGLNKPGTLIEVEVDGKLHQYLIGDINVLRGVCDDCTMFDKSAIVKRYKVVWTPEK
jgi:hypothetical protein